MCRVTTSCMSHVCTEMTVSTVSNVYSVSNVSSSPALRDWRSQYERAERELAEARRGADQAGDLGREVGSMTACPHPDHYNTVYMMCVSAGGAPEAGAGGHDPCPGRGEGEGGAARHQAHRPGHTDEEQVWDSYHL